MPEPQETHGGADFLAKKLAAAATPPPDRRALVPPSIGRIVHFVLPGGKHRPAIITEVWGGGYVNLQVFLDGPNDAWITPEIPGFPGFYSSVGHDEGGQSTRSWHWPEFVT